MAGKITFRNGIHPSRVGGWVQPVKLTDAQLASLGSYVGRPITADSSTPGTSSSSSSTSFG